MLTGVKCWAGWVSMRYKSCLKECPWFRGIGVEHQRRRGRNYALICRAGLGIQKGLSQILKGSVIVGVKGGLPVSGWLWKDKGTDSARWRSIGIGIRYDSRLFD